MLAYFPLASPPFSLIHNFVYKKIFCRFRHFTVNKGENVTQREEGDDHKC